MIKRALISVYDKTGIAQFAQKLAAMGVEILSTGGTARALQVEGVAVTSVSSVTQFPEILDGRVKTLHPAIHGGLLAKRDNAEHMATLAEQDITPIDLVICNLYPFAATIAKPGVTLAEAIENIDIGGPSMIRSAAKNFRDVIVLVDPQDYEVVLEALQQVGDLSLTLRQQLAAKAFAHTAHYDSLITNYLSANTLPKLYTLGGEKVQALRYGENPHQEAAAYRTANKDVISILNAQQLQGKPLSYNNINDADAALRMVLEFQKPAAIAVKHTNPCGAALADDILTAYKRAYAADPVSIFGGIVAVNRAVTEDLAKEMVKIFLEVIIAPCFSKEALAVFKKKSKLRLLEIDMSKAIAQPLEVRTVLGGLLIQDRDAKQDDPKEWEVVSKAQPSDEIWEDAKFAWKLVKHVKSNSITIVKNLQTLGTGCGQVNRIDAAKYALSCGAEACQGAILASDGLLPFPDVVEEAAKYGVSVIIQPGGSIRDGLSIAAANKHNMVMIFTGTRHFKH